MNVKDDVAVAIEAVTCFLKSGHNKREIFPSMATMEIRLTISKDNKCTQTRQPTHSTGGPCLAQFSLAQISLLKVVFSQKGLLFQFFIHFSSLFRGKMDEKQAKNAHLFYEVMSYFLEFSNLKPNETVKVAFSRKGF